MINGELFKDVIKEYEKKIIHKNKNIKNGKTKSTPPIHIIRIIINIIIVKTKNKMPHPNGLSASPYNCL